MLSVHVPDKDILNGQTSVGGYVRLGGVRAPLPPPALRDRGRDPWPLCVRGLEKR